MLEVRRLQLHSIGWGALLLVLAIVLPGGASHAAQITTTWDPLAPGCTGSWSNTSCWTAGSPNNAGNTYIANVLATPNPTGIPTTLTLDGLQTDVSVTLDRANGSTFNLIADTGGGTTGDFVNAGVFNLNSTGSITSFNISGAGTATLTGGGTIRLSDNSQNRITGTTGATLVNVDNTIEGRGQVGTNALTIDNQGTIDANVSGGTLVIDPGSGNATNTGTMKASNGGLLTVQQGTFANTGGTIAAEDASIVQLSNATIVGGDLATSGSGVIRSFSTSNVLEDVELLAGTSFDGMNGSDTTFRGTLTNRGTIQTLATSSSSTTELTVEGGTVTLDGGGTIRLGDDTAYWSRNYLRSDDNSTLINLDNTIEGMGYISQNTMTLDNRGTIDANVATRSLIVDPGSGNATNTGTMKASNGGILTLQQGAFANTGGTIAAEDGSLVQLSGATITGGDLQTSGSGEIRSFSTTNVLEDVELLAGTSFVGWNGSDTTFRGTLTNGGTIQTQATSNSGSATELTFEGGTVTLDGGGTIRLGDDPTYWSRNILRSDDGSTLINLDNTIEGAGYFGQNSLTLDNRGTIDANVSTRPLYIDPNAGNAINTGTIKGSNGGHVYLQQGTFANAGGTIAAEDGSTANLNGATVIGGDLQTSGSGVIRSLGTANVLEDVELLAGTDFDGWNASATTFRGTITNRGSMSIESTGSTTEILAAGGNVTLTGGGTIDIGSSSLNRIRSGDGSTLTNVDNTIQGGGQILVGLQNSGTVSATSGLMYLSSTAKVNDGLFRAETGGTLRSQTNVSGTGSWRADGGVIQVTSGAVTTTGDVDVVNNGRLSITNSSASMTAGDLSVDATGALDIDGTLSVDGDFSILLTDETDYVFDPLSVLEMTGGVGATVGDWDAWSKLEIAGTDYGTDPATHSGHPSGFSNNFDLATLRIGAGASILLADLFDNGNRGGPFASNEALYVDHLIFEDGAGLLNLNGLNLYYGNLVGSSGQIVDVAVPEPGSGALLLAGFFVMHLARRRA